jgi:MATE family multidrug resistance protein
METTPFLSNSSAENFEEDGIHTAAETSLSFEFRWLVRNSIPISAGLVLLNVMGMASVFVLGHLETKYLAGVALTTMYCNITGFSVTMGMATALDTLCSQSFTASTDKHSVGRHLQRVIFVELLLCFPILYLWWHSEQILIFFGQDPEIAALTGLFTKWMSPGLIPNIISVCVTKYLQAQGIMAAQFAILCVISPLNFLLQWFFVFGPVNLGAIGGPIATSVAFTLMPLALVPYTAFVDGYQCWGGIDIQSIFNYGQLVEILKLGIPGILMVCSEWWAFEIMALAAGLFGETMLAAQTMMLNTCCLLYLFPMGAGAAGANRIGNYLGENKYRSAKVSSFATILLGTLYGGSSAFLLFILRNLWAFLFTSDLEVIMTVVQIMPLVAFYQICDGIKAVTSGVLQGCGLQNIGAVINLGWYIEFNFSYYGIGLPLAGLFGFYFDYKLVGLWGGLISGLCLTATISVLVVKYYINWEKQAALALERADSGHFSLQE